MSHYTVLVIGEDVERQLAPFDENIEMPEYKNDIVSEDEKKSFTETYTNFEEGKDYGAKSEEEAKQNSKLSFEELYKKYGKDWNGSRWRKETNRVWANYSTYNPDSKWDWFEIGGRWAGSLKLKKNVDKSKYDEVNFSYGWSEEEKEKVIKARFIDSALKKDIDFSHDKKAYKKALRFWELKVEKQEPKTKEDKEIIKWDLYKPSYYKKRYKTKENYAKLESEFSTHAILKDGEWVEAGQMGWFGCSSATPRQEGKFAEGFYDKFIKDLPPETKLTIVDCHI